jgi:hypothetical protein
MANVGRKKPKKLYRVVILDKNTENRRRLEAYYKKSIRRQFSLDGYTEKICLTRTVNQIKGMIEARNAPKLIIVSADFQADELRALLNNKELSVTIIFAHPSATKQEKSH